MWVKGNKSESAQKEWLKDQILTRVLGFGWSDCKCAWSSKDDPCVGSVPTLIAHLRKIVAAEATRPVPNEAHCPVLKRKTLPQLGDPSIKVEELDARAGDSMSAFKAAAVRERERREAAGIGDAWQNAQQTRPPEFSSLKDKQLEVRYKYELPGGETAWLWCPCKVLQVRGQTPQIMPSMCSALCAALRARALPLAGFGRHSAENLGEDGQAAHGHLPDWMGAVALGGQPRPRGARGDGAVVFPLREQVELGRAECVAL